MDIETIEICCVNTTLMVGLRWTQEPDIDHLKSLKCPQEPYEGTMKINV